MKTIKTIWTIFSTLFTITGVVGMIMIAVEGKMDEACNILN